MLEWAIPSAIISLARQQNFYSETDITVDANYSSLDGKNSVTIAYLCQAVPITGQTTPADVSGTLSDNVQDTIILDNLFGWNIAITITDAFGGTVTYNAYAAIGVPFIYFDRFRSSMGINAIPSHDKSFEINGDVYSTNNNVTGQYKINGTNIFDLIYPVGSIYISVNNTDPGTLFGGTWDRIKDTFLLSAGDTYAAGSTGGEATHTLTTDEMPSHSHFQQHQSDTSYVGVHVKNYNSGGSIQGVQPSNGTRRNNIADPSTRVPTVATGGGQAHNNLPPYLAVYVWKRTA